MSSRAANTVTSDDRWSCPRCGQTVVITANHDDTRWCLTAAMRRHGDLHQTDNRKRTA